MPQRHRGLAAVLPRPAGPATITGNSVTGLRTGATAFVNNSSGFTATVTGNAAVNGNGTADRADGVDLESTSDTGGGYDVGWTGAGQWQRYTVDAAAGTYTVSFRIAAPVAVTDASAAPTLRGPTAPGVGVQTWSYGGGANQSWQPVATGDGGYRFVARNSGLCLESRHGQRGRAAAAHLRRDRGAVLPAGDPA